MRPPGSPAHRRPRRRRFRPGPWVRNAGQADPIRSSGSGRRIHGQADLDSHGRSLTDARSSWNRSRSTPFAIDSNSAICRRSSTSSPVRFRSGNRTHTETGDDRFTGGAPSHDPSKVARRAALGSSYTQLVSHQFALHLGARPIGLRLWQPPHAHAAQRFMRPWESVPRPSVPAGGRTPTIACGIGSAWRRRVKEELSALPARGPAMTPLPCARDLRASVTGRGAALPLQLAAVAA
jgi:hypothetical protein